MGCKVAILYDIENLIGGYKNFDMLSSLSLRDIYNDIKSISSGDVYIQRAYANWSDSRLNVLRGDIVELGIDPIQMFGFGRGPVKNASDIQLAIDAVEIALMNKAEVDTFVIVSGDGGFSSLAKKLREYGYKVIGCSFKKATNRVFKAVCDDFIWIEEGGEEFVSDTGRPEFNDPILRDFSRRFKSNEISKSDINAVFKEAVNIIKFLSENKHSRNVLKGEGLNISIFSQAISYRVDGFNTFSFGFSRLVDFLRYIVRDGEVKLFHKPPSEYRLFFSDVKPVAFEMVSPIYDLQDIHTVENYRALLSKGDPVFHSVGSNVFYVIASYMATYKNDFTDVSFGDMVEKISLHHQFDQTDIKRCILSFISAGCFHFYPEDGKISEKTFSFIPASSNQAIDMVKESMRDKLEKYIGSVDEDVFLSVLE